MSIESRRNFLSKTSSSIDNIRKSVTSLGTGLVAAGTAASSLLQVTNESNKFKRTLEKNDNQYFSRRRESVLRKQREDELEASSITGVTKRQGSIVQKSTKGFLGRALDFVGVVILGWAITNLPTIIKKFEGLFKLIKRIVGILGGFMSTIGDFLTGIDTAVTNFLNLFKKFDFGENQTKIKEKLEEGNSAITKLNTDFDEGVQAFIRDENIAAAGAEAERIEKGLEEQNNDDSGNVEPQTSVLDDEDFEAIPESTEGVNTNINIDQPRTNEEIIESEGGFDNIEPSVVSPITDQDLVRERELDNEEEDEDEGGVDGKKEIEEFIGSLSGEGGAVEGISGSSEGIIPKATDLDIKLEPQGEGSGYANIDGMFDPVGSTNNSMAITPLKKTRTNLNGKKKSKSTVMIVEKNVGSNTSTLPMLNNSSVSVPQKKGKTTEKTLSDLQVLTLY